VTTVFVKALTSGRWHNARKSAPRTKIAKVSITMPFWANAVTKKRFPATTQSPKLTMTAGSTTQTQPRRHSNLIGWRRPVTTACPRTSPPTFPLATICLHKDTDRLSTWRLSTNARGNVPSTKSAMGSITSSNRTCADTKKASPLLSYWQMRTTTATCT